MSVFYAMNLGMHVDQIGDLDLKILVIRRFEFFNTSSSLDGRTSKGSVPKLQSR